MTGVPLICVSIGVVTVCSTVCASAPVNAPVTCTTGGVISGYWLIGKLYNASNPTSTITIEITMAVFGLFINTSAIMLIFCGVKPFLLAFYCGLCVFVVLDAPFQRLIQLYLNLWLRQ